VGIVSNAIAVVAALGIVMHVPMIQIFLLLEFTFVRVQVSAERNDHFSKIILHRLTPLLLPLYHHQQLKKTTAFQLSLMMGYFA
jgi:hypothetical protein